MPGGAALRNRTVDILSRPLEIVDLVVARDTNALIILAEGPKRIMVIGLTIKVLAS